MLSSGDSTEICTAGNGINTDNGRLHKLPREKKIHVMGYGSNGA